MLTECTESMLRLRQYLRPQIRTIFTTKLCKMPCADSRNPLRIITGQDIPMLLLTTAPCLLLLIPRPVWLLADLDLPPHHQVRFLRLVDRWRLHWACRYPAPPLQSHQVPRTPHSPCRHSRMHPEGRVPPILRGRSHPSRTGRTTSIDKKRVKDSQNYTRHVTNVPIICVQVTNSGSYRTVKTNVVGECL